mmetsp:Transcript_41924/g.75550  ORF Transcript_41924/g.75550 Transcript_41924/m.75550 type:complete len:153 (-) Transcript_41924:19-477(-)
MLRIVEMNANTDVRMRFSSSSPGARQEHQCINSSMKTYSSPSKVTHTHTTATEAFNKGLLLQYILSILSQLHCCNHDSTDDCEYETNWKGHQPLTPYTWSFADDDTLSVISASELRLMRRRRRRGVKMEYGHRRDSIIHVPAQVKMPMLNKC